MIFQFALLMMMKAKTIFTTKRKVPRITCQHYDCTRKLQHKQFLENVVAEIISSWRIFQENNFQADNSQTRPVQLKFAHLSLSLLNSSKSQMMMTELSEDYKSQIRFSVNSVETKMFSERVMHCGDENTPSFEIKL